MAQVRQCRGCPLWRHPSIAVMITSSLFPVQGGNILRMIPCLAYLLSHPLMFGRR